MFFLKHTGEIRRNVKISQNWLKFLGCPDFGVLHLKM